MLRSPAHAQAAKDNKEETKAMVIGSAFHTLLLEPELFESQFTIADIDGRTKEGKFLKAKYQAEKISILSTEEKENLDAMVNAVKANKSAMKLLKDGVPEMSIFFKDEDTEIDCKIRPDYTRKDGLIIDIKSCIDASKEEFEKTIINMDYYIQAAMYLDGVAQTDNASMHFIFIAVEKTAPFGVGVYALSNELVEAGRKKYKKALHILDNCIKNNSYPCYPDVITEVNAPRWFLKQADEE